MALCTHFAHASHFSAFAVHAGHDKSTNHAPETVRVCSTRTCSLRNLQALFCTAFKGVLAGCLRLMMKPLCVLKSTVV
jgi:hypothetical protein